MNTLIRYLVLSETTVLAYTRNHPLFRTIRDLTYRCACVGAYCIRPSIIPNKNGQSFGDSWSVHSSLAGCLWGVCNTPLHGDENGTCRSAYIILSPTNPSCLFATPSFGIERDVCGVAGGLLGRKILNDGNVV